MNPRSKQEVQTTVSHNSSAEEVAHARLLEYHIRNTPKIHKFSSQEDIRTFKKVKYLFETAIKYPDLILPEIVIKAFESLTHFYFMEGKIMRSLNIIILYKDYLFKTYKAPDSGAVSEKYLRGIEILDNAGTVKFNLEKQKNIFENFDGDIDNFGKKAIDEVTLVSAINFITSIHLNALKMGIEYEEVKLEITPLYDLAGSASRMHLDWRCNAAADAYFQYAEYQVYRLITDAEYTKIEYPWTYRASFSEREISKIFRLSAILYGSQREVKSRVASILAKFYDPDTRSNYNRALILSDIEEIRDLSLNKRQPIEDSIYLTEHLFLSFYDGGHISRSSPSLRMVKSGLQLDRKSTYILLEGSINDSGTILGDTHPVTLRLKAHKTWFLTNIRWSSEEKRKQELLELLEIAEKSVYRNHEATSIILADLYRLLAVIESSQSHIYRNNIVFYKVRPTVVELLSKSRKELEFILGKKNIKSIRARYEFINCRYTTLKVKENLLDHEKIRFQKSDQPYVFKNIKEYKFGDYYDLAKDLYKDICLIMREIINYLKARWIIGRDLEKATTKIIFFYFIESEKLPLDLINKSYTKENFRNVKAILACHLFIRLELERLALESKKIIALDRSKKLFERMTFGIKKPNNAFYFYENQKDLSYSANAKIQRYKRALSFYGQLTGNRRESISLMIKSMTKLTFSEKITLGLYLTVLPTISYIFAHYFKTIYTSMVGNTDWINPQYFLPLGSYLIGALLAIKLIKCLSKMLKPLDYVVFMYKYDYQPDRYEILSLCNGDLVRNLDEGYKF